MGTEVENRKALSHSADYIHIENCLKKLWVAFAKLEEDMVSFEPRPRSYFAEMEAAELARLVPLNPDENLDQLRSFVSQQFDFSTSAEWQFHNQFDSEFNVIYIQTVLVSHALIEASVNTICAVGLSYKKNSQLFNLFDRADIKDKWRLAPKAICPEYNLPTDCALYETLGKLTKERNGITHYKIELRDSDEKLLDGTKLDRSGCLARSGWIRRFCSLPFDLVAYVNAQLPFEYRSNGVLFQRSPIPIAVAHKKAIDSLSAPVPTPAPRTVP